MEEILQKIKQGAQLRSHSGLVEKGDIFVALAGSHVDGSRFITDAIRRGAAVIVHAPGVSLPSAEGVLFVETKDPVQTLGRLARAAFGTQERIPLVTGVTGTNGKTTVAHLLHFLLEQNGYRAGLIGTVVCQWPGVELAAEMTTPDCLSLHKMVGQMVRDGVTHLVMEMSSHALDQQRIAGLPVQVGIFTNLTQDHLDYHHDMETYFEAKSKLFLHAPSACARGVVNVDDAWGRRLKSLRPELMTFGIISQDADLHGEILSLRTDGMRLRMKYAGQTWELQTTLAGKHNASNLLACQGAALLLGLGPENFSCLAQATGAPGRLERVPNTRGLDIFVDYAHTPDALENVSVALKAMGFHRLLVVFGCGGDRDATKRPLMGEAVARYADVAILTSDNPRTENPDTILDQVEPGLVNAAQVIREVDRRKAIGRALELMRPGDALLIAGKGHETYQIIGTVKHHFSDFEVVREYLA